MAAGAILRYGLSVDLSLASWAEALPEPPDPVLAPYRSYRATWRRVVEIEERAARVSTSVAGESVAGEPIWCVAVEPPEPPEASVLVVAGIHSMEHVGVAAAVALLARAAGEETRWRRRRLLVMPIVNPDGFREAEEGLANGRRRFWRKNARGVDLNRNFETFWDRGYYLARLLPRVFAPGEGPLSEPEARAVDAVLEAHRPRLAASLHAFGKWIFLPYAGSREKPPDAGRLEAIGREMAARQPYESYRVGQLGRRSRFFKARGAEIDHFYQRRGALSFLFEIGAGPRLSEPSTWTLPYRWFTPPAPLLERDVANVLPALEYLADA